jgi:hypothetical protein
MAPAITGPRQLPPRPVCSGSGAHRRLRTPLRQEPARVAALQPSSPAMPLQRNAEMVWSDRHPEFPREISEHFVRGCTLRICLHSPQSGIAQRNRVRGLAPSPAALGALRRRRRGRSSRSSRAPSPASRGGLDSPEPRQHPFGDFQLIELGCQLFTVGVEPRQPLHYLLLFLSNLFHGRHLLFLPSPMPKTPQCVTAALFCDKWSNLAPKKDADRKIIAAMFMLRAAAAPRFSSESPNRSSDCLDHRCDAASQ